MDSADRAILENESFVNSALHHQRQRREKAELHHEPKDSVQYCIDCGEPIPAARLKAVPGALRCVECQRLFEQQMYR